MDGVRRVKSETRMIEPLHPSSIKELETTMGPEEPVEEMVIDKATGFPYRTCIGELIFAYVTCRLDIGCAVTELSKLSTRPAPLLNSRSPNRARTYTQTCQSTLRATQVRAALSHAYAVTYQNRITDKP
jgi:hypothetical protein